MKKIIIVAEDYGYCPTSYAFTIARALNTHSNRYQIAIIETPSVKTFSELNPEVNIKLLPALSVAEFDLLISCYEPEAIVRAWLKNKPCIYYCNLLWFWLQNGEVNLEQVSSAIDTLIELKRQGNKQAAIEFFIKQFQANPISTMMYGYFLANQSFCRRFPGWQETFKKLPDIIRKKLTTIGIPMPYSFNLSDQRKNIVLFQLSGGTAPTISLSQKQLYLRGCYQLALILSRQYPTKQFIFCANQHLLRGMTDVKATRNLVIRTSISQKEQFLLLSQVEAIFTPPGLGTTYEALYCKTPLFFLPEQNIGQYPNWLLLKRMGIEIPAFLAHEQFKEEHVVNETDGVKILFDKVEKLFTTRFKQLYEAANTFLTVEAPKWQEKHAFYLQMFMTEYGQQPFLVGNEITAAFGEIINNLVEPRAAYFQFFDNSRTQNSSLTPSENNAQTTLARL